jgi:hypothetical protein
LREVLRVTDHRAGDDNAVAPRALGVVEGIVREREQETTLVCGFLETGYPDRDRQPALSPEHDVTTKRRAASVFRIAL